MTKRPEPTEAVLRAVDEFRRQLGNLGRDELDAVRLERQVQEVVNQLGCTLMREVFERADETAAEVRINGQLWGHRRRGRGTYRTLFGEVEVDRSTYQQRGRGRVQVPLELRLGVVESGYTPVVARVITRALAVMPTEEAEGLLTEAGVCKVSRSTLQRLPQAMAARYERERYRIDPALRAHDTLPEGAASVQVALDGVMVPQDGEHAKARGRTTDAPAPARHEARYGADPTVHPQHDDGAAGRAWHEASVGTLSFWDAEGEHLRTIYLAQMPESGKATLCEGLTDELLAVVAERPELRLTFASDGARAHWTALEAMAAKLPAEASGERAFVLDFFHAAEYLTAAANEAYGEGTPQAKIEAAHWRETLREHPEGAARVLASLRYHRARASSEAAAEELDSIISYLAANANAGRMGYAAVKGEGLPIGTGVTEAAAKTLVSVRMKRAGARYSQHGGQTILLFRSALLSERFEALSEHLEETYRATLQAA